MMVSFRHTRSAPSLRFLISLLWAVFFLSPLAFAKSSTVHGKVSDPLGGSIPKARVVLLQNGKEIASSVTDDAGSFSLSVPEGGRYSIRAEARGFQTNETAPLYVAPGGETEVNVSLAIGTLPQAIVVSATGTAEPQAQVSASANVIGTAALALQDHEDVSESLRGVPGLELVQAGQPGAVTSLFVRGGNSDFNKVLIDGIPANDIGGAFDFANLSTAGVNEVEILRGPNSVMYGSDAVSSVISISTPKGSTASPEIDYEVEGGNFGTLRNDVSIAGTLHAFDYFSEFSRFDTNNSLPNSGFHNGTYAGNFGWAASGSTSVRLTARTIATGAGVPNALAFYGIPDDSQQGYHEGYYGITVENQTSPRWHNLLRLASSDLHYHSVNPAPTGLPFDPFAGTAFDTGPNYLGDNMAICGANGYCTSGQAILDFGGVYPQTFDSSTLRRSVYAQTDYGLLSNLTATAGVFYENEEGRMNAAGTVSAANRNNFRGFLQANGNQWHRLYLTAGAGFDDNAVFGFAATPRVSAGYYLRSPSATRFFSDTRLTFNFGTGIKEPGVAQQLSSLYALLTVQPGGAAIIAQNGIGPVGPERSQSFDSGIEQTFWSNRARLNVTFFQDRYYDLIEFVAAGVLPELGVPANAAVASGFGAYINSDSYRSQGAEIQLEIGAGHGLRLRGEYTYLDEVVTQSFTGSALAPALNPAFPSIPIGAYAPLVGGRPFDRAPQSGGLTLDYVRGKFGAALQGSFVGRRDDSTFLSDAFFGASMLLPNRNLDPAYQLVDLSGRYTLDRHIALLCDISNLLNQRYQEVLGYPALPLAFRAGMKFTLGGEAGWWK